MTNKKIIAIRGRAGSGKDTVASIFSAIKYADYTKDMWEPTLNIDVVKRSLKTLQEDFMDFPDYELIRIADKVKEVVATLLGVHKQKFENREYKETPLGEEWWYYKNGNTLIPYDTLHPVGILIKPTPRLLLQLVGTECGRNIIHPNVWINSTIATIKDTNLDILIPDLRFKNEKTALEKIGAITIEVKRDVPLMDHPSETELENSLFDYTIYNDGSIDDLINQIINIYNDISTIKN